MTAHLREDTCSKAAIIFSLAMICYSANGKTIGSGDTLPARYLPFSILRQGSFYLDDYPFLHHRKAYWASRIGDHYVSSYPVGAPIAALPWYAVAIVAGRERAEQRSADLEKLAAAGTVALSVAALYAALRHISSRRGAFWITLAYALGTSSLSLSSQALWQHGPAQLALSVAILCLVRAREAEAPWAGLAGLPLGFAVVCRQTNVALLLPVAVYVALVHRRQILFFAAAAAVPLSFQLWYNAAYLGDAFAPQVPLGFRFWRGRARNTLPGLLVSPSRGLFFYSPVLVFSLVGFALAWRKRGDLLVRILAIGVLLHLAVHARWWVWWGGGCYGPRYLADLTPVLAFAIHPCVGLLERVRGWRIVFGATLAWSMLAHAAGAYWYDGDWDKKLVGPNARLYERLWSWSDNPLLNSFREASAKVVATIAGSPALADLAREHALLAESQASPDEDRALLALRGSYAASEAADHAARVEELRRSRFTPEHRLDWKFEDELVLAGIDWSEEHARMMAITFYWRAERRPSEPYAAFTWWSGTGCGEKQDHVLGMPGRSTTDWSAGQTFKQRRRLVLPESTRSGCVLHLGVWSPRTGSRLYIRNWPLWERSRELLRVSGGRVAIVSSPHWGRLFTR